MSKRLFDIAFSLFFLFLLFGPMIVIAILIKLTSKGPVLHWSKRVGQNSRFFLMPKFRSMKLGAPQIPTDLLVTPQKYITPIGKVLRKSSLDELPQLFSVLRGDMSIVGPRPALFNQDELINLRKKKSIDSMKPGITGWAQINGRDQLSLHTKVAFDEYYLKNRSLLLDLRIIFQTGLKILMANGVSH